MSLLFTYAYICNSSDLTFVPVGLGMVTPLGRGVETTWRRLIGGECGIRGLTLDDLKMKSFDEETKLYTFNQLSSKVAAFVPYGSNPGEFDEGLWLNSKVFLKLNLFLLKLTGFEGY